MKIGRLTCFGTGSQDGRQVEHFSNGGVAYDVILEYIRLHVAGHLEQSNLMVDDQQDDVVLVNPFKLGAFG